MDLKGRLFITNRIPVFWGGFSQQRAELLLLKSALSHGPYDFYHLITGADLPLMSQEKMHAFFDDHLDEQFISLRRLTSNSDQHFLDRVNYFYPFQDHFRRTSVFQKILRKMFLTTQKLCHIHRIDCKNDVFGIGSAYFDITQEFAEYLISQEQFITKTFAHTFCTDEMFVQTVFLRTSKFQRYEYHGNDIKFVERTYLDVRRFIDWTRGNPRVLKKEDFELLKQSNCLFARKVDSNISSELINEISKIVINV